MTASSNLTRPVQAALVGTGFIGPVHLEALRRLAIPVRGLLASSPEKSITGAQRFGLEFGYSSYEALLADPEVTIVHLTSPNRFHRDQVIQALEAGKHVVCEKPLGMDATETGELVNFAAAHPGQICAVAYNIRFYPVMLHLRSLIAAGEFGEILHVHGSYEQDWLMYPDDFNWRVLASEGGELRAVGDIGTHWLDLAQFVTGQEIAEVCADLRTVHATRQRRLNGPGETFSHGAAEAAHRTEPVSVTTDDHASLLLRFAGGARGSCFVSQVTAGRKNCVRLEVAGTRQSAAWNSECPDHLWLGRRNGASQLLLRDPSTLPSELAEYSNFPAGHAEGFPDTFKQLFRAIYSDVRAGRRSSQPLYATFDDGHRELLLCEAILRSHRARGWEQVVPSSPRSAAVRLSP